MGSIERAYYERPRLYEAEASVLAVEGGVEAPILVLDRALLFPGGGGQPADQGTVDGVEVASVSEEGGRASLRLAAAIAARPGDLVRIRVDGSRRRDYSQQHTAEHLIAQAALRLLGARAVSVHFGPERSLVDFDSGSIGQADLDALEDEVELLVAADLHIRTHLCPPGDISAFPLRRPAPEGEETLRVVEIDGIDFTPCCGLHVASTLELRLVRILGAERYKGMSRVYFLAGGRAAADYRSVSRIAREAARTLGTAEAGLAGAVGREAARRAAAERELAALRRGEDGRDAAAALEAALAGRASGGGGRVEAPLVAVRRYADRGAESLMETAKAFADAGLCAIVASMPDLTAQAISPAGGPDLGKRLKAALTASGGRGGGGPASFRAVFADVGALESFLAAAEPELAR